MTIFVVATLLSRSSNSLTGLYAAAIQRFCKEKQSMSEKFRHEQSPQWPMCEGQYILPLGHPQSNLQWLLRVD